ncbi:hypothetical protein QQG74_17195 [Micromonospora sp. FIMYZ51]|uniref:hypothetical protein n=1 Tax=Micromonospora sp. FIMYZ51 TaxID=3051832 RepID=UPI00311F78D0
MTTADEWSQRSEPVPADERSAGFEPVPVRARALRLAVAVPLVIVGVLLLSLWAFMLLYWSPALTGPGLDPCDPAVDGWGVCWRPEQRTFWIVAAAAGLSAATCLVISLKRLRRARRWWPWPVATAVLLAVCYLALGRIA